MQELFLDGKRVDLFDKSVAQTLQVNDLADIKDRNANYTNRISLPKTARNINALDLLSVPGNQSRKPYEKVSARYVVDGVELISNGYATISQSDDNRNNYSVVIYSGNKSLFESIQDLTLRDLNFQDLNHQLLESAYLDSIDNLEGYIYALADFAFTEFDPNVEVDRISPSLFVSTIWKKIFEGAGFTYEGSIFQNSDFTTEVISTIQGYDVNPSFVSESNGLISTDTISFNASGLSSPTFYRQIFQPTVFTTLVDLTLTDNYIEANFTGALRVGGSVDETIVRGMAYFEIVVNDEVIVTKPLSSTASGSFQYDLSVSEGDRIQFVLRANTQPEGSTHSINLSADANIVFNKLSGGVFVDFATRVPKTKQADFIKDIMQRYGLMFQALSETHYQFITMEEMLNNREAAEDWSDKLSELGTEAYKIGNYSKSNTASYNYEDGVKDFSYDGSLEVNSEILPDEGSLFSSPYTIPLLSSKTLNAEPLLLLPIWEAKYNEDTEALEELNNVEDSPRVLRIKRVNMSFTGQIFNAANTFSVNGDVPFLSLDNMSMDYFLKRYYLAFNRLLDAPKLRADFFILNNIDVYNLDFFKLKYVKQLGKYFYVNKINSFKSGKPTRVNLIQANGFTINQPPSQLGTKSITLINGGTVALTISDFIDTTPPYEDPEFDPPQTIQISSFGTTTTKIFNNGVEISSETILDANNLNLEIKDDGVNTSAHSASFTFKIQSYNNANFSSSTGTISVSVEAYVNLPPVADAGNDSLLVYESDTAGAFTADVYGTGTDPNGDALTYNWDLSDVPGFITVTAISGTNGRGITLSMFADSGALHNFTFDLTLEVTDTGALMDTDTREVTIKDLNQI